MPRVHLLQPFGMALHGLFKLADKGEILVVLGRLAGHGRRAFGLVVRVVPVHGVVRAGVEDGLLIITSLIPVEKKVKFFKGKIL